MVGGELRAAEIPVRVWMSMWNLDVFVYVFFRLHPPMKRFLFVLWPKCLSDKMYRWKLKSRIIKINHIWWRTEAKVESEIMPFISRKNLHSSNETINGALNKCVLNVKYLENGFRAHYSRCWMWFCTFLLITIFFLLFLRF